MRAIERRLAALEKSLEARTPIEPAAIVFYPCETAEQPRVDAEIRAHEEAGRKVIVFRVEDASLPESNQPPN